MKKSQPETLRIGLVSDHLFPYSHGGAERVYRQLADAIANTGSSLTYLTRRQWKSKSPPHAPFHIEVVWEGELYDSNGTRRVGPALTWAWSLNKALWHKKFDVLIVSATPIFNVFVGLMYRMRHPHSILIVDWLEIWPFQKWRSYSGLFAGSIAWLLQRFALLVGDCLLVNSRTTLLRLPKSKQLRAILLPLKSLAGPPLPPGEPKRSNQLLFVGRHFPDKNLALLPGVLKSLADRYPDVSAVVVGSGTETARVRQNASTLGVLERITFTGNVPDDVLETLLAESAALFFPSVREGFGLVVCEAARFGTPSIVVDHPDNAARFLVDDGINGLVVPFADEESLAAAVSACFNSGESMSESTRQWYEAEWNHNGNFEEVADRLIAFCYLSTSR